MSDINFNFDAAQYQPRQSGSGPHPPAEKIAAKITDAEAKPSQNGDSGFLAVTFTTALGSIVKRYNLWNKNQVAVDIAHGELSALCHATRIMRVSTAKALIGGECCIDVVPQLDKNTAQPNGYTEVKKVYDKAGNDPTQPLQTAPQTAPSPFDQPSQSNPWGNQGQAHAPGFANPGQATQQSPAPQPVQPAWQQSAAPAAAPPWMQQK